MNIQKIVTEAKSPDIQGWTKSKVKEILTNMEDEILDEFFDSDIKINWPESQEDKLALADSMNNEVINTLKKIIKKI